MKDELKSLIPWRKHSNIIFSGLLTLHGLPRITNYFFTFNHPNYARWLVRYHDNLLKLSETHKDVYDEFKKGCFGIKRTKKDFSRLPIDLTLEQTVNADAASQVESHILQIQYLQGSDGLIVILSEWRFIQKFLISSIWQ